MPIKEQEVDWPSDYAGLLSLVGIAVEGNSGDFRTDLGILSITVSTGFDRDQEEIDLILIRIIDRIRHLVVIHASDHQKVNFVAESIETTNKHKEDLIH